MRRGGGKRRRNGGRGREAREGRASARSLGGRGGGVRLGGACEVTLCNYDMCVRSREEGSGVQVDL